MKTIFHYTTQGKIIFIVLCTHTSFRNVICAREHVKLLAFLVNDITYRSCIDHPFGLMSPISNHIVPPFKVFL